MEDASQQSPDGFASAPPSGERAADLHNLAEQPLSPKNERIVSASPSLDTAVSWAPGNTKVPPATSEMSAALSTMYPLGAYTLPEQGFYYGGYDNGTGNWDEHSNYANVNNLQVMPPAMYNDNQPHFFPPGYGFDSPMAYGQFSPLPSPLSPIMFDGQLYSPHQMPVSSPYYPPPPVSPGLPHVTSAFPASQPELMSSEISGRENPVDNAFFGPGSGFYMPFGAFGGGDISGNSGVGLYKFPGDFGSSESLPNHSSSLDTGKFMSPMAAGTVYPHSIGILGPYEQNVAQTSFQGYGLTPNSSARHYPNASSYQRALTPSRNQLSTGRGGRRDKDRDCVSVSTDTLGITDRNRGPRFSKAISKSVSGEGTSAAVNKNVESISGIDISQFNAPDFTTDYEKAKFFVIKSFSEDNVHRSIKYNVWASTSLGNRKLDAAYSEANGICPVFLFFSVNASGQFCGVAEMVGPVDFDNDANYWQQDRWSGQFPVKWHIIKDVPNTSLRHILLQNNENKPVTHSRDSQEVKLEQGIEMLKIFKNYDAESSLLDDFDYYDEREKSLQERKVKQPAVSTGNPAAALATASDSINQLSDNLGDALRLDGGNTPPKTEF